MINAAKIGSRNQIRSRNWVLKNYDEYHVLKETDIIMKSTRGYDFFSICYDKNKFAGFDLLAFSRLMNEAYAIQVKTNYDLTTLASRDYVGALISIDLPEIFHKELHIWHKGKNIPQIIKLDT